MPSTEHFEGFKLSYTTKTQILSVSQANEYAEEKLTKSKSHGQPAIEFLKELRMFDPRYKALVDQSFSSYKAIPGVTNMPSEEFESYLKTFGPAALKVAPYGAVDLDVFWDGLHERLLVLSCLAKRYVDAVSNSAGAECSNSIYKLVLSKRRSSTTNQNLKASVFLHHNQQLQSGAFERELKAGLGEEEVMVEEEVDEVGDEE